MNSPIVDPVRPAGDAPLTTAVPASTQKQDERRVVVEERKRRRRQERRENRLPPTESDAPAEDDPSPLGPDDEVPPTVNCLA